VLGWFGRIMWKHSAISVGVGLPNIGNDFGGGCWKDNAENSWDKTSENA
jgi:hypothetical protein